MSVEPRGVKRLIDPDTKEEINVSKKPKIDQNAVLKQTVLTFLMNAYYLVQGAFLGSIEAEHDIGTGIQIMNVVQTAFTALRQQAQGTTESKFFEKVKGTTPGISHHDINHGGSMKVAMLCVRAAAEWTGLAFQRTTGARGAPSSVTNWYGIAGPYINFLTGFQLRFKELRLGHQEMTFGKRGNEEQVVPVSRYGLSRQHHCLLEGCRFPPEKRSSMAQSLGPMTILLNYLNAETAYANKPYEAALRAFAHIPYIDSILKIIKGREFREAAPVVSLLADNSIMTTTRQANRAFPPPNMFFLTFSSKTERADLLLIGKFIADTGVIPVDNTVIVQAGMETEGVTPVAERKLSAFKRAKALATLAHINFSGAPAFALYKDCEATAWTWKTNFTEEQLKQIGFHCWFGTYKEDFGILEAMTKQRNWFDRNSLADKFRNQSKGTIKAFKLCEIVVFSKLASASQTGLLAQNAQHFASLPVFSGKRTRYFAEDIIKTAQRASATQSSVFTGIASVVDALNKIRTSLAREIAEKGFRQEAGTTEWFSTDGLTMASVGTTGFKPKPVSSMKVQEVGKSFV